MVVSLCPFIFFSCRCRVLCRPGVKCGRSYQTLAVVFPKRAMHIVSGVNGSVRVASRRARVFLTFSHHNTVASNQKNKGMQSQSVSMMALLFLFFSPSFLFVSHQILAKWTCGGKDTGRTTMDGGNSVVAQNSAKGGSHNLPRQLTNAFSTTDHKFTVEIVMGYPFSLSVVLFCTVLLLAPTTGTYSALWTNTRFYNGHAQILRSTVYIIWCGELPTSSRPPHLDKIDTDCLRSHAP